MNTTDAHPIRLSILEHRWKRAAKCLGAAVWAASYVLAQAVTLGDHPALSAAPVAGNMLMALSVEYPTALSWAYKTSTSYSASTDFKGYFDPYKCYQYSSTAGYFVPIQLDGSTSSTVNHVCPQAASLPLWSGNWLNWATMQTIDPFRWALTGGRRVIDNGATSTKPGLTVLEKAWASGQGGNGETGDKSTSQSLASRATPFKFALNTRIWGLGNKLWISNRSISTIDGWYPANPYSGGYSSGSNAVTAYVAQTSSASSSSGNAASTSAVYELPVKVQVCVNGLLESNCQPYLTYFKPEGLMQQYSLSMRYGAFGYLNDSNVKRDGGVLRAQMNYIGPTQPVPGASPIANQSNTEEWNGTDGTLIANPSGNAADVSATNAAIGSNVITTSGAINYINNFGSAASGYKTYDPVSELYYSALRYFRHVGPVRAYSNLSSGSTSSRINWADGFPVITNWHDPILYSCQKNFILGIGDVNTHADANLPGSTLVTSNEPATPPEVTADLASPLALGSMGQNVKTSTDSIGALEGVSNLGSTATPCCTAHATYYIAGLAYDAHTRDMRPNDFNSADGTKANIQTVSTYWVDVQEYGAYKNKNQYYYAAKYGGFSVPTGYNPLTNTTALPIGTWHTNNQTFGNDPRPDHYFSGGQADWMINGLKAAFASASAETSESMTVNALSSPVVSTSGNGGYSTQYDSKYWYGEVTGSQLFFDSSNNLVSSTQAWSGATVLEQQAVVSGSVKGWDINRHIATCCDANGHGIPFRLTSLPTSSAATLSTVITSSSTTGLSASTLEQDYLNYLRGDRSNEGSNGLQLYRARVKLLGDIVNSQAMPTAAPSDQFSDIYNPGYSTFVKNNAKRKTVIYVGANDGMLHAFDGTLTSPPGGSELFAYVPSFLYQGPSSPPSPSINGLAGLGNNQSFEHHYYVDATPYTFDVDLNNVNTSLVSTTSSTYISNWRTVLIGGLGKGGKGYYAIDVTCPGTTDGSSSPSCGTTINSEVNAASAVMWEFTDPTMGFSYGNPIVVKTVAYGWVAILTSGYNDSDGHGYFYIVNPATGALIRKIDAGSTATGLAYASAYVADYTNNTADSVYAGDLGGHIWRLDLTSSSKAFTVTQLAAVVDPSTGQPQPITTRPLIEISPPSQKRYVVFGTGQLLSSNDINSTQVQSFYAIIDGTASAFSTPSAPITRGQLQADTNLVSGIGSSPSNTAGWYVDLPVASNGVASRVNVSPVANFGVVAFAANLPSGDACNPTGTNAVYGIDFSSGKSVLIDKDGNAIISYMGLGGVVTNLSIVGQGNNTAPSLMINNDHGSSYTNQMGNIISTKAKQINWREIPTSD